MTGEIQADRFGQFADREMSARHAQLLEHGLGLHAEAAQRAVVQGTHHEGIRQDARCPLRQEQTSAASAAAQTLGGLPPDLAREIAGALAETGVPLAPDVAAAAGADVSAPSPLEGEGVGGEGSQVPDAAADTVATPEHLRLVAERCLYGVDLNPMAVELARVSLWLATMAGDKPLTFLDHHLKCGNSLIGARLSDIDSLLIGKKKARKGAQQGSDMQGRLFTENDLRASFDPIVHRRHYLGTWQTETVQDAINKADLLRSLDAVAPSWRELREICDLWCAAWFWPDDEDAPMDAAVYGSVARHIKEPAHALAPSNVSRYREIAREVAAREHFFHWELQFPEVYFNERGHPLRSPGFDAVIGNPPWDNVKPNSREFFTAYEPCFRELGKQAAMKRMEELRTSPEVESRWCAYEFDLERKDVFFRNSGQYPYQTAIVDGKRTSGDTNTYKLFLERFHQLVISHGHAGIIVQSGLYTDEGCTGLRQLFFERSRVDYLYGFESRNKIFPIDSRTKFVLFGFSRGNPSGGFSAAFMLREPEKLAGIAGYSLRMPQQLIRRFSPGTLSLLEFRTQRDIDVIERVYGCLPLLSE